MPLIKLSYPEDTTPLLRQLPQQAFAWHDYHFVINDTAVTTCDYWVVYNKLLQQETVQCAEEHTLFMSGEPNTVETYHHRFLSQFYQIASCQSQIDHANTVNSLTGQTWFINKTYDELMGISKVPKTKAISVLCSNKQFTPGHKQRFEFVRRLKQHFGEQLDWFGRGIQDFDDKWDVLAPYRFSLAIENSVFPDYATEKVTDCFLAETIPLYYGAPNVNDYYPEEALVRIDLNDFDATVATIEGLLAQPNYHAEHLAAVQKAKMDYLNEYQFFPLITRLLTQLPETQDKQCITIKPETAFNLKKRMKGWLKKRLGR